MSKVIKKKAELDIDFLFDGIGMKAYTKKNADGIEKMYIGGTASSTAKDLYGDIISPTGQTKMLEKLRGLIAQGTGLTAWLNHSYKIPEDTLGKFTAATLSVRDSVDSDESFVELDIECELYAGNPRAMEAYNQVKEGIRHGWSIGGYFLDVDWASPDPDDYGMLVNDVDLLEISLVGIPANQRAWAKSAGDMKARAVHIAEGIIKAASPIEKRELVLRSFIEMKDTSMEVKDMNSDSVTVMKTKAAKALGHMDPVKEHLSAHGDCSSIAMKSAKSAIRCMKSIVDYDPTKDNSDDSNEDDSQGDGSDENADGEILNATLPSLDVTKKYEFDFEKKSWVESIIIEATLESTDAHKAEIETLAAEIATKATELATMSKSIEDGKAELATLTVKIEEAKNTRLGRKGVDVGATHNDTSGSVVSPEAYTRSAHDANRALGASLSGKTGEARDRVS